MSKDRITLNLSWQELNELIRAAADDYNRIHKRFSVSMGKKTTVLRAFVMIQKNVNFMDCRISLHPDNDRAGPRIIYAPSVIFLIYIMIFILSIIISKVLSGPFTFEMLFCILLFIIVPALICISEMKSYKHFWNYFDRTFTPADHAGEANRK